MDFEEYARVQPIDEASYRAEETQWLRVEKLLDRCVGSVLDVGGGDGYIARRLMDRGHSVTMLEASESRCERARALGVTAYCRDSLSGLEDVLFAGFDTVLLGEVLEHLDDPGTLLRDAFRIARQRVVITVPLLGWADPTHRWRISLDHLVTPDPRPDRPATSEQILVTMQRGACWPVDYWRTDPKWAAQFIDGH